MTRETPNTMPFTKEQKREGRKKKKLEEQQKIAALGAEMIAEAPPMSMLKKPIPKKDLDKPGYDHGGHQKALNFVMPEETQQFMMSLQGDCLTEDTEPMDIGCGQGATGVKKVAVAGPPEPGNSRVGTLSLGWVYEGDWKMKSRIAGNGERTMCKVSEQFIPFLLVVKEMLYPMLHPTLQPVMDETLRVNILCGARTLAHNDSFRGNTPNAVYIVHQQGVEPGHLCCDTFPDFKYSVVKLFGKLFIPFQCSEVSNECKCIGEHPLKPNTPCFFVFPLEVIDQMEPHGELDFGVIGWTTDGWIHVVPGYEDVCIYRAPLIFEKFKWQQVLGFAKPVTKKPRKRIVKLDKLNTWMLFKACRHRHWWVGNPMTLRYHAFFRSIRETPTMSNIIRRGPKINYIDAKDLNNWKHCDRSQGRWLQLHPRNTIKDYFFSI